MYNNRFQNVNVGISFHRFLNSKSCFLSFFTNPYIQDHFKMIFFVTSIVTHRKCIAKHVINHRISADWSTTKPIVAFFCTPGVPEVQGLFQTMRPLPAH